MSAKFVFPDWARDPTPPQPQPDTTDVDPHRVEALVNRFIAAKQDALFTAPDAYYRQTGADAVDGAPAILDHLNALRDAMLGQARGGDERALLGPRLDLHIADASDGIDRHIAAEREAFNRQVVSERQALIQRAAELEHTNDDKLAGLAEANASAAHELARMNGEPEGPAIEVARSAIWHSAIGQRIANGDSAGALELFQRARHQLTAAHVLSLDTPLQVARQDQAAERWIASQTGTDGPSLRDRVAADPTLPPDTQHVIRAKVDARDSAEESKRAATIQALDDQVRAAYRAQAANPGAYKPGTFARLADAYAAAGDLARAEGARRAADWESFMLPFAQASAEKQQRMIDELPPGEIRDHATGLRDLQAHLFSLDAFAAGTAVYKEVGPPVPIDDIQGRVRQARQIATLRGGTPVVPFTADEINRMQRAYATASEKEKQAIHARLDTVPEDMRPMIEAPTDARSSDRAQQDSTFRIGAAPGMPSEQTAPTDDQGVVASPGSQSEPPTTEPAPGTDVYRAAEEKLRAQQVKERVNTDRTISQWVAKAQPGSPMPNDLAEQLTAAERQQIEDLVSGTETPKTDPNVLAEIINGLKSRNPEMRTKWAQTPLYRYRSQLSASDFRKVVELQDDLDPEAGYSRSEIARIRKQLADKPDTSHLDRFYEALAPDPDVYYSEYFPIGVDSSGKTRWLVLPQSARRFVKGFFDLLKGTKTGELTPEAVATFTGIHGGAGSLFGPRGGAGTLTAGGGRALSAAERRRRAEQLEVNKNIGRAWERDREAFYAAQGLKCTTQITIRTTSGLRGRVDCLFRDRKGRIRIKEFKASPEPYIRPRQREFFDELRRSGGTIVGKGKGIYGGGTKVPKTKVEIDSKLAEGPHVDRPNRRN